MALSGTISSPTGIYNTYIRLDWARIAVDTAARTSTIRYRLYLVLGNSTWVDATETGFISGTYATSNFSRGTTYRGVGPGSYMLHEYTEVVTHYDANPLPIFLWASFKSGWSQLGALITDFAVQYVDAMAYPTPPVRYWVGGTATWDNTAGSKWSTTAGGAGGASVPGPGDDVYIQGAGTCTLGIDVSGVRDIVSNNQGFNLNGKTLQARKISLGSQTVNLTGGKLKAYKIIQLNCHTLTLTNSVLEVYNGESLGEYEPAAIALSPWIATVNGSSSCDILMNVNDTVEAAVLEVGSASFRDARIYLGSLSSGGSTLRFSGSPTFRSLLIQSKNSAAHTVEFDSYADIRPQKFIAIGSSSSNKLTIKSAGSASFDPSYITFPGLQSCYGKHVHMNYVDANDLGTGETPAYIGSGSTVSTSLGWLLQDPPGGASLVDPLAVAPASSTNFNAVSVGTSSLGVAGGGYTFPSSSTMSTKDTFDLVSSGMVFQYLPAGGTLGISLDGMNIGSPPSVNGFIKISADAGVGAKISYSSDGVSWTEHSTAYIFNDPAMYRSVRVSFYSASHGAVIGALNILPETPTGQGNFLLFFGGL